MIGIINRESLLAAAKLNLDRSIRNLNRAELPYELVELLKEHAMQSAADGFTYSDADLSDFFFIKNRIDYRPFYRNAQGENGLPSTEHFTVFFEKVKALLKQDGIELGWDRENDITRITLNWAQ